MQIFFRVYDNFSLPVNYVSTIESKLLISFERYRNFDFTPQMIRIFCLLKAKCKPSLAKELDLLLISFSDTNSQERERERELKNISKTIYLFESKCKFIMKMRVKDMNIELFSYSNKLI